MRDYDLELIAALVEGRLEDETEARALIASSPEHAAEYESQKLAYEALKDLGPVALSDTERAALHRDVWTSLHVDPAGKTTSNPWWYRWTAVAAALVVVGGSAAVLSQNMGGDDAMQTFAEISEPLDAGEQSAATTTAAASDEAPTSAREDSSGGGDGASITTIAPDDGEILSPEESVGLLSTRASEIRQGEGDASNVTFYGTDEAVDPVIENCVTEATEDAGLAGYSVVATMDDPAEATTTTTDSSTTSVLDSTESPDLAVASPITADPAAATLAFVDLDSCEVVYLDE